MKAHLHLQQPGGNLEVVISLRPQMQETWVSSLQAGKLASEFLPPVATAAQMAATPCLSPKVQPKPPSRPLTPLVQLPVLVNPHMPVSSGSWHSPRIPSLLAQPHSLSGRARTGTFRLKSSPSALLQVAPVRGSGSPCTGSTWILHPHLKARTSASHAEVGRGQDRVWVGLSKNLRVKEELGLLLPLHHSNLSSAASAF